MNKNRYRIAKKPVKKGCEYFIVDKYNNNVQVSKTVFIPKKLVGKLSLVQITEIKKQLMDSLNV